MKTNLWIKWGAWIGFFVPTVFMMLSTVPTDDPPPLVVIGVFTAIVGAMVGFILSLFVRGFVYFTKRGNQAIDAEKAE
jgi:uncharacterized membrane protein